MESDLLGIGAMARQSGLTISALRFYDAAGVLVPASVAATSGYRKYRVAQVADARLVARLRRVAMPLVDIRVVLECRSRPAEAAAVLDRHLQRLTDGLADAHRELSTVKALLDKEMLMTEFPTETRVTVPTGALLAALSAVRFAVSEDPDLPMLAGVLFDMAADGGRRSLTVVATDRYRLAVSSVDSVLDSAADSAAGLPAVTGPSARVLASTAFVDEVCRLASGGEGPSAITIVVAASGLTATRGEHSVTGDSLDHDFPDYKRLVKTEAGRRFDVDTSSLTATVRSSPALRMVREQDGFAYDVVVLTVDAAGRLRVAGHDDDEAPGIGVNREFLLEALAADGSDQLSLELAGPIAPLVFRSVHSGSSMSLLMPTRLQSA